MIRKVTNDNVNEVMEMCFKKFKKTESCNVTDDPDKGQYTLTPRPRLICGVLEYAEYRRIKKNERIYKRTKKDS